MFNSLDDKSKLIHINFEPECLGENESTTNSQATASSKYTYYVLL